MYACMARKVFTLTSFFLSMRSMGVERDFQNSYSYRNLKSAFDYSKYTKTSFQSDPESYLHL